MGWFGHEQTDSFESNFPKIPLLCLNAAPEGKLLPVRYHFTAFKDKEMLILIQMNLRFS